MQALTLHETLSQGLLSQLSGLNPFQGSGGRPPRVFLNKQFLQQSFARREFAAKPAQRTKQSIEKAALGSGWRVSVKRTTPWDPSVLMRYPGFAGCTNF